MRINNGQVTPELLFVDTATNSKQIRVPVLDVIRNHVIARDGMFVTQDGAGGSVAGYAAHGWAYFGPKELAKGLKRAPTVFAVTLPDRHGVPGLTDGYLFQLHADDAVTYGVDLTIVDTPDGKLTGCLAITATAYVFALTGCYPRTVTGLTQFTATDLKAVEVTKGLEALRQGSVRHIAARPATQFQPALPATTLPAFPEGNVIATGTVRVKEVVAGPYDTILAGKVQVEQAEVQSEVRNSYGMGGFTRRGRNR